MKLTESSYSFMQNFQIKAKGDLSDSNKKYFAIEETKNYTEPIDDLLPRDGMSAASATFFISRCAANSQYQIHNLENRGRYFTAIIMDSKGNQVNELIVDKLNGRVQFLRVKKSS